MEWQTPAVSEKFQSRFGRRPGTSDSVDTGLGTSASDNTEGDDFLLVLPPACRMCYVTPEICLSRLELQLALFTARVGCIRSLYRISKFCNMFVDH